MQSKNHPIWQPTEEFIRKTNIFKFKAALNEKYALSIQNYSELHSWSVTHPEHFWRELADFGKLKIDWNSTPAFVDRQSIEKCRWFPNAKLNFAANLLQGSNHQHLDALVFKSELGVTTKVSYKDLNSQVLKLRSFFKSIELKPLDRVAALVPNIPEAVSSMLATTSLGASWSSCSPDFGVQGILDRFGQINPTLLIAADGYTYNGKAIDCRDKIFELCQRIPSIKQLILIPFLNPQVQLENIKLPTVSWKQALDYPSDTTAVANWEKFPFNHPLFILYSSGTTGIPKCIVHGAGGTLLQHTKEHLLHNDLKPGDVTFFFTTCGWMMWNLWVSALVTGVTVALYEGSPTYPDFGSLFKFAEDEKITSFGTSPRFLAALEKANYDPSKHFSLPQLRTVLSTGAPLLPEQFLFIYQKLKADIHLCSISGGTDIVSCFCLGNPISPVYSGELQAPGLGMDMDVFSINGTSVRGTKGELVCKSPFPSAPLGFLNDTDGSKFHKAYFDVFPNVWKHGDWAEITESGGYIIYGRSDAVLNPGGVRIGTAEIYRQVETLDAIQESICVGQNWEGDVRVVLFVKLKPGVEFTTGLVEQIKKTIRLNTTSRHVPAKIISVPDIPRTVNGKLVELAVKKKIHGEAVENIEALANPESLKYFEDLKELQT